MSIAIREHAEEYVEAVRRFNRRLADGGAAARFPCDPVPGWLPPVVGRRLFQEYFLAVDEAAEVRGAYALKHQDFWIKNREVALADYRQPVSEGAVDRRFPQVGVLLLRDAMHRQPILFGFGIGVMDEPLSRLLVAAGWRLSPVPFFFRVERPFAFLRNVAFLRRSAFRRFALDAAAFSGLGWLGIRCMSMIRRPASRPDPAVAVEVVEEFSAWADELWRRGRTDYGLTAVRDAETLRLLYPKEDSRFIRLALFRESRPIGWAVLMDSRLVGHKHFGAMRLGSIVDAFARPADAGAVVCAAAACLRTRGVDLIVSNQSHAAWRAGFRRAGFFQGPSNFLFAASPKLAECLGREGIDLDAIHVNRGDGDGPINL